MITENADNAEAETQDERDESEREYASVPPTEASYKRPPTKNQFKKGASGNPKGRPKGSMSVRKVIEGLLRKPIKFKKSDRTSIISASDALVTVALDRLLKGEPAAITLFNFMAEKTGLLSERDDSDSCKYGYLVTPMKLPPDEWDKWAARALEHCVELKEDNRFRKPSAPQEPRKYKVLRSVSGETTIVPIEQPHPFSS
jgi:Family of unknown function (DUF5681)